MAVAESSARLPKSMTVTTAPWWMAIIKWLVQALFDYIEAARTFLVLYVLNRSRIPAGLAVRPSLPCLVWRAYLLGAPDGRRARGPLDGILRAVRVLGLS